MAKPRLEEKEFLNPEEAIRHWNFSSRKFYRFLDETDGGKFLALRSGVHTLPYRNAYFRVLWIDLKGHRPSEQNSKHRPSVAANS